MIAAEEDDQASPRERRVTREVQDVRGRLVGKGQGRDPGRLREPDRVVGQDRAGLVKRMADRCHPAFEFVEQGCGPVGA